MSSAIVLICLLVWLAEIVFGTVFVAAGIFEPSWAIYQPYRFVTSIFMHSPASPLHIFFNMFAFVSAAPIFEKMFGKWKFLGIFLGSGILGNIFFLIWNLVFESGATSFALGASGGVFGLFGGLIILYKHLGVNRRNILTTVGINLLISFYLSNIAWQAHVGGLIGGIAITYVLVNFTKTRSLNYW